MQAHYNSSRSWFVSKSSNPRNILLTFSKTSQFNYWSFERQYLNMAPDLNKYMLIDKRITCTEVMLIAVDTTHAANLIQKLRPPHEAKTAANPAKSIILPKRKRILFKHTTSQSLIITLWPCFLPVQGLIPNGVKPHPTLSEKILISDWEMWVSWAKWWCAWIEFP